MDKKYYKRDNLIDGGEYWELVFKSVENQGETMVKKSSICKEDWDEINIGDIFTEHK